MCTSGSIFSRRARKGIKLRPSAPEKSLYCCKQYWTVSGLARGPDTHPVCVIILTRNFNFQHVKVEHFIKVCCLFASFVVRGRGLLCNLATAHTRVSPCTNLQKLDTLRVAACMHRSDTALRRGRGLLCNLATFHTHARASALSDRL